MQNVIRFCSLIQSSIQSPDYFNKAAHSLVSQAMTVIDQENVIDSKKLCMLVEARDLPKGQFNAEPFQGLTEEEGTDILSNFLLKLYGEHKKDWSKEMEDYAEKTIALTCIDKSWTRHIDTMANFVMLFGSVPTLTPILCKLIQTKVILCSEKCRTQLLMKSYIVY